MKTFNHNKAAYNAGHKYSESIGTMQREMAFTGYREACAANHFDPSISASVCFVAGYLGNGYPSHDNRVTS